MTPKAQRIAICLHVKDVSPLWRFIMTEQKHVQGHAMQEELFLANMPDYPNDLNAMHEAEKTLSEEQWVEYIRRLSGPMSLTTQLHRNACHATSAQRSEAFLKTVGKWEKPE